MFSRFTEKAIQTIMLAQEEAKKFHHNYVGTEHILLGILNEGDNAVIKTLKKMSFNPSKIKTSIEEQLEFGRLTTDHNNVPFTQQAKQTLSFAWDESRKLGHNHVNIEHLFLSIFRDPTNIAARILSELGIDVEVFKQTLFEELEENLPARHTHINIPTPTLDLFGRDLTALAKSKKLDPVIGRDKEIKRMIQILCRRTKNNPVLTGEPGVGKTAIVEGLAQRITHSKAPLKLKNKRLIMLDLGLLVAGTKYRGEFEDRVKKIMEESKKAKHVILFIDELHTIIGTGGSEGSLDAANLLKPSLARGELQCIGATTLEEYRKHIEQDGALERRFQPILVNEPSEDDAIKILEGIKERYESFHNVTITPDAIKACVQLSMRYITDRNLPDKAIDLMDEAAAKIMLDIAALPPELNALNKKTKPPSSTPLPATTGAQPTPAILNPIVDKNTIYHVLSNWTGINVAQLNEKETHRLKKMNTILESAIIGQDEAVHAISRAVKRAKVGLKDPNRPLGSFLFLGPTGVGKSELAKQLALFLFSDKDALIRIDMSEFMEKHTVSRLIGAPPGYVGFNEGGELTEPIRRRPYSVVLFDELEKASPEVINILLQILDDGRLTDANGRTINFKNTIIIMTSNVGSKFIENNTSFGFYQDKSQSQKDYSAIHKKLTDELSQEFKPEFLNRIDDIVVFKILSKDHLLKIIDIMLRDTEERLCKKNISIRFTEKVKEFLVDKGYKKQKGARPLRRAIQEHFEDPLVDAMLLKGVNNNIIVTTRVKDNQLSFSIRKKRSATKLLQKKPALVSTS